MPNPYADCKILGPYVHNGKKGRLYVKCTQPDGKRHSINYSRYILELAIGRKLSTVEHVHHINKDIHDNRLENLEVLDETTHHKLHVTRLKPHDFTCPMCGGKFTLDGQELNSLLTKRKLFPKQPGPFCDRSCASRAVKRGVTIQSIVDPEYYSTIDSGQGEKE